MPETMSLERRQILISLGAKILLSDGTKGMNGAEDLAHEIVNRSPEKYFMPDQFSNQYNQLAHYDGTAQEMLEQMGGRIDYFVSALGTSGTLMGVGLALKERLPGVKIVSAHPVLGHYIQGLKNLDEAIVPAIYDAKKIDRHIMIESEDAFDCARRIAKEEGIFVGMSSGAALWAARKVAEEIGEGTIVTIFPDRGEKYLSTALFQV